MKNAVGFNIDEKAIQSRNGLSKTLPTFGKIFQIQNGQNSIKNKFQCSDAQVSDAIRQWLRMPTFDARPWEDEELLLLLQQMYLDHDFCSKFAIDITTLRNFLYETYKNYNDVPFHNFRHCFCVAQMVTFPIVYMNKRK